jgi:hypothetical protein
VDLVDLAPQPIAGVDLSAISHCLGKTKIGMRRQSLKSALCGKRASLHSMFGNHAAGVLVGKYHWWHCAIYSVLRMRR